MTEPPAASHGRPSARLFASLVLALALAVGVLAGIALDRRVLLPRPFRGVMRPPGWVGGPPRGGPELLGGPAPERDDVTRRFLGERLARELKLTPAQRVLLDSIVARQVTELTALRNDVQPRLWRRFESCRDTLEAI